MKTMPTRIDGDLFESAKMAGEVQSRSAAQQLDHWARIGRELEASPAVTQVSINRVLAGRVKYDDVSDEAQAAVRVAWSEGMSARISALDYEDELNESGLPWAEADADGKAVIRGTATTDT